MSSLSFRSDVQGLRALAVGSVVIFHANPWLLPGGFVGVDIFFVISGYVITRIILDDLKTGSFSIFTFYFRRIRRIFPALLTVLLSCWIAAWFLLDPLQFRNMGGHFKGSSAFIINFWLMREGGYFGLSNSLKPLLHLWSLSIEEQFYLIWPILLYGLFRFKRLIPVTLFLIFSVSLLWCLIKTSVDANAAFYQPWCRAWELTTGAFIAYFELFPTKPSIKLSGYFPAIAGCLLILVSLLFFNEAQSFPGWRAVLPVAGAGLIIASRPNAFSDFIFGGRATQYLGSISYPLYLWHWPLYSFSHVVFGDEVPASITLALTILAVILAAGTYYFVEKPIARVAERRYLTTVTWLVAGMACAYAAGVITVKFDGFFCRFSPKIASVFAAPDLLKGFGEAEGVCFSNEPGSLGPFSVATQIIDQRLKDSRCLQAGERGKKTIFILGDSHSLHLLAGLRETIGEKANIRSLGVAYCTPMIKNVLENKGIAGTPRCRAYNDYVFNKIREVNPDIIIVGGYFKQLIDFGPWHYPDYVAQLVHDLKELHADGIKKIIVVGEVPIWSPPVPTLIGHELMEGKVPSIYQKTGLEQGSLDVDKLMRSQNWGDGVRYVSLVDGLCNVQGCLRLVGTNLPDDMIAYDYGHLTTAASLYVAHTILSPIIEQELIQSE